MRRRPLIFVFALAASLALHALVLVAAGRFVLARDPIPTPNAPLTVVLTDLDEAAGPPDADRMDSMGEANGTGIGSNSAKDTVPLQARQAEEDQAFLSRDPVGHGRVGEEPSKWTGPTGEGGMGGRLGTVARAPEPEAPDLSPAASSQTPAPSSIEPALPEMKPTEPKPAAAVALAPQVAPDAQPTISPPHVENSLPIKTPSTAPAVQPKPRPQVANAPARNASGDARRPGPQRASADPARESDSESDPFSKISRTVKFQDGRLDVQLGRKVKTTRPHLLIAGELDLYGLSHPSVTLKVNIDKDGNVTSAEVLRSSGKQGIDQPCRVCVYDWWFEPTRDKTGKPVPDVVVFTFLFR